MNGRVVVDDQDAVVSLGVDVHKGGVVLGSGDIRRRGGLAPVRQHGICRWDFIQGFRVAFAKAHIRTYAI